MNIVHRMWVRKFKNLQSEWLSRLKKPAGIGECLLLFFSFYFCRQLLRSCIGVFIKKKERKRQKYVKQKQKKKKTMHAKWMRTLERRKECECEIQLMNAKWNTEATKWNGPEIRTRDTLEDKENINGFFFFN